MSDADPEEVGHHGSRGVARDVEQGRGLSGAGFDAGAPKFGWDVARAAASATSSSGGVSPPATTTRRSGVTITIVAIILTLIWLVLSQGRIVIPGIN